MDNKGILRFLSFGALAVMILGILFGLFINRFDLIIRGVVVVIPVLIALFILNRYDLSILYNNKSRRLNLMNILFGCFYVITFVILYLYPYRTMFYFLFVSFMFLILFIQIIFGKNDRFILFKIVLLFLNLAFGVTLKYPFFYGNTDSIIHYYFTQITISLGHIIPINVDLGYHYFPLFHIFLAIGNLFSNLNSTTSYFVFSTLPFAFTIIFVYLLMKNISKSDKISLLSCLIYSFSPIVVFYSHYEVTRVFAFNAFIILCYLFYKFTDDYFELKSFIVTSIINIYLILVHQTSIAFFLVLIMLIMLLNRIYKNKNFSKYILLNLIFITSFYYIFITTTYTDYLVLSHLNPDYFETLVIKDTIIPGATYIWIRNNIHTAIFLFLYTFSFAIVTLNDRKKINTNVMLAFSILTLIFYIPTPLQTILQAMDLLRFDRISLIISPMMSFAMAAGVILIIANIMKGKHRSMLIGSLVLITMLSFFSMTTSDNAPDCADLNPAYTLDSSTDRAYFTSKEVSMLDYILKYSFNNTMVYSNYPVSRFFSYRVYFPEANVYGFKVFTDRSLERSIPASFRQNSLLIFYDIQYQFKDDLHRIYDNDYTQINAVV